MTNTPLGFRITGPCTGERKLIDWRRAFAAYCAADVPGGVEHDAYLSAFTFGDDFRAHLHATGSTKGYDGACDASFLWFDIDRDDIDTARADTAKLVLLLCDRYALDDADLLIFFSGAKGFHIGLPMAALRPNAQASENFTGVARVLAESLAAQAGIDIDTGVYDKVRAFRAPNSRHPKTGLYKVRLELRALMELDAAAIAEMAKAPEPFDVPTLQNCDWNGSADWAEATEQARQQAEAKASRRAAVAEGAAASTVNRLTLAFIREGAPTGDRHRLLFSAAANLAEWGAPLRLCAELLRDAALDSGLPPAEVERQIRCGHDHAMKRGAT